MRAALCVVLAARFLAGCGCGGGMPPGGDGGPDGGDGGACGTCMAGDPTGFICCEARGMCVPYNLDTLCGATERCPMANLVVDGMCTVSCSMCMPRPPLDPGQLATHLDMAALEDGSLFLSGYSPGNPPMAFYGDLVTGAWDPAAMSVDWEIVDGAPTMPVSGDPTGWRGGVSLPGDDVGLWTSVVQAGETLHVAYHDRTNGALKLASGGPGSWNVQVVDDTGFAGRYASLLTDGSNLVIAYNVVVPPATLPGTPTSIARVASGTGAAGSWTTVDVHTAPAPCRVAFCPMGASCLEDGNCVTPTMDCAEACMGDQVCFNGSCQTALDDMFSEDIPVATGLYNALAETPTGLALVFYDRTAGNVMGAAFDGSAWGTPFLIDGYGRGDPFIGDCGIGASLSVDAAGVWHVSYADGSEETLRYARVEGTTATTELVDDGSTDGTMRHPDGRHIVGDDSSIVVTEGGEIRIAYQDATAQRVMLATRPVAGMGWAVRILDGENSTGYWIEQVLVGGASRIATWWRQEGMTRDNGVRVLDVE